MTQVFVRALCALALFFSISAFAQNAKPTASSLCAPTEEVLFSCQTQKSGKTVSVCISADFPAKNSYMYYAFGKKDHLELVYPQEKKNSKSVFKSGFFSEGSNSAGGNSIGGSYISFVANHHKFTVYSLSSSGSFQEQGVVTSMDDQRIATSKQLCNSKTFFREQKALGKLYSEDAALEEDKDLSENGIPMLKSELR